MHWVEGNKSLKDKNTFGFDVSSRYYYALRDPWYIKDLSDVISISNQFMVLGGGSNVVFTKQYNGVIIHNQLQGIAVEKETDHHVWVRVGGGVNWHSFVMHCLEQEWGGVENLALIPGNVGAAPIQNIGAYGVECKDVMVSLKAHHLLANESLVLDNEDCVFGYRDSIFKNELKGRTLIHEVTFKLTKNDHVINASYGGILDHLDSKKISRPTIQDIAQAVVEIRQAKLPDPNKIGNAGSFFKNPVLPKAQFDELKERYPDIPGYGIAKTDNIKVPAGWLIDRAGWKGKTHGEVGVYKNQALVLVNHGEGNGQEILSLSSAIMEDIFSQYSVHLEREVNIV